jgi:TATA-box binding protein (TBP) (component of TFIID and TFIIIB)
MNDYGNIYKKVRWDQAFNFFQDSKERKIEPRELPQREISDYLKSQPLPSYPNLSEWSQAYFEELHKIKQNPSKKSVPLVPELFNVHMSFKISRHPIDIYRTMKNNYNHPMMKMTWMDSPSNMINVIVLDENTTCKRINKYRPGEVSIWTSGKCTFTGRGNIKIAKETIKIITTNFSENDPKIIKSPRIKINNISAKIELLRKISRNALLFALHGQDFEEKDNSCWKGETTGISKNSIELKMKIPNVFFEFYESGKVIIRGAKKEEDIYKAVEKLSNNFWLKPFLNQHKS